MLFAAYFVFFYFMTKSS